MSSLFESPDLRATRSLLPLGLPRVRLESCTAGDMVEMDGTGGGVVDSQWRVTFRSQKSICRCSFIAIWEIARLH